MGPEPSTSPSAKDEVVDRFRAYRDSGDRVLRNALVEEHLGLADFYVKRYSGRGVAPDDLRQVAFLAIVRAVERFDPEYGIEFSTFASRTIEGELKRYFRDRTWSVRPPRRAQELHLEVRRSEEDLHQRLGRSPTVNELADDVGETVDHVLEAMEAGVAHSAASLDQPDPSDDTTAGVVAQRSLAQLESGFVTVESRLVIERLLEKLPERERVIIEMRFFANMTQPEIAEEIGVSQSYLSRILRKALVELRGQLEG